MNRQNITLYLRPWLRITPYYSVFKTFITDGKTKYEGAFQWLCLELKWTLYLKK